MEEYNKGKTLFTSGDSPTSGGHGWPPLQQHSSCTNSRGFLAGMGLRVLEPALTNGVADNFCAVSQLELLHQIGFVRLDGFHRYL